VKVNAVSDQNPRESAELKRKRHLADTNFTAVLQFRSDLGQELDLVHPEIDDSQSSSLLSIVSPSSDCLIIIDSTMTCLYYGLVTEIAQRMIRVTASDWQIVRHL
jgi:hypothetical protein